MTFVQLRGSGSDTVQASRYRSKTRDTCLCNGNKYNHCRRTNRRMLLL